MALPKQEEDEGHQGKERLRLAPSLVSPHLRFLTPAHEEFHTLKG
jgi:hypothetical protein